MGWCGSLPVDYSPCNMLALWDCGLRLVSSAGSAPTAPGLQTEKETPSLWAGGGGLPASVHIACQVKSAPERAF